MKVKRKGETSFKETAFGIIPRSKLVPLEIEGIKKAWDFILKKNRFKKVAITSSFLQKVHQIGFGWIFPAMGGKFRKIEVAVSKLTPPHFYEVHVLMKNFTEDLNVQLKHLPAFNHPDFLDKLIGLLAWAHHRFLWIHPFADYNGRIGRLLISMILLNLNLPPIELKVETKKGRTSYIHALQKADNRDYIPLEKIIRSAMEETVRNLNQ